MKKLLLALLLLLFPLTAYAHKISAFVDFDGDKVTVMSYFSDGTPVREGKVEVYDRETGELLLTGKTDRNGEFSFKLKKPRNLKVVVTGELGHRAVSELELLPRPEAERKKELPEVNTDVLILRKVVREELKRQLEPLRVELSEVRRALSGTSFKDIFAGLGWILGIFGGISLVLSRRS